MTTELLVYWSGTCFFAGVTIGLALAFMINRRK